jgi:hypothetical protein
VDALQKTAPKVVSSLVKTQSNQPVLHKDSKEKILDAEWKSLKPITKPGKQIMPTPLSSPNGILAWFVLEFDIKDLNLLVGVMIGDLQFEQLIDFGGYNSTYSSV